MKKTAPKIRPPITAASICKGAYCFASSMYKIKPERYQRFLENTRLCEICLIQMQTHPPLNSKAMKEVEILNKVYEKNKPSVHFEMFDYRPINKNKLIEVILSKTQTESKIIVRINRYLIENPSTTVWNISFYDGTTKILDIKF